MYKKSLLILFFAGLAIITASSFSSSTSSFERHTIEKSVKVKSPKKDIVTALYESALNKKTMIASFSDKGIVVQNQNTGNKPSLNPNILFFIADDMTSIDCGPYGNKDVHTPNLDKLAKEGICFENMNNATAMCGPTRQSLYTGIFPVKNGSYPNHARVYDNIISIVQHFTKIGYRVALIGKQHYAPLENFPFEYLGGRNSDNGVGQDIELLDAQKWIDKDKVKPYLLIVATNQPHNPWTRGNPKQYDKSKISIAPYMVDTELTRESLVKYYAEITYADSLVGNCMKMVDNSVKKDNTMFIFASEQGNSMPFAKWTCYNMGLKSAFIARWPKVIKPSTRTDILAQYIDVVPTLFEAAGGDPKTLRGNKEQTLALDGKSFYATLCGKPKEVRKYIYGVHTTRGIKSGSDNYPVRSIQDHNYKLIWNLNYSEPFLSSESKPGSKLYESWLSSTKTNAKQAQHARLYRNRPEFELYDIKNDSYELNNLADDESLVSVKIKLISELKKWMVDQGDKGIKTEAQALSRLKGDTLNWKQSGD